MVTWRKLDGGLEGTSSKGKKIIIIEMDNGCYCIETNELAPSMEGTIFTSEKSCKVACEYRDSDRFKERHRIGNNDWVINSLGRDPSQSMMLLMPPNGLPRKFTAMVKSDGDLDKHCSFFVGSMHETKEKDCTIHSYESYSGELDCSLYEGRDFTQDFVNKLLMEIPTEEELQHRVNLLNVVQTCMEYYRNGLGIPVNGNTDFHDAYAYIHELIVDMESRIKGNS